MKKYLFVILAAAMGLSVLSCGNGEQTRSDNPLLNPFDTPFQVPPFEQIKMEHYLPAFEAGMKEQSDAIAKILANTETPTLDNTLLPFAYSGMLLSRVSAIFYNIESAETTPEMQELAKTLSPLLSAHSDNIYLNVDLYNRLKSIPAEGLNEEQARLLEQITIRFKRAGVELDETQKTRLREINQELSMLSLTFGNNTLAETNGFTMTLDNEDQLAGLPQNVIDAAAATAKSAGQEGKWVFTPHKPSMLPFLTYSTNSELRSDLYKLYYMRGDRGNENDNKEIISKMVNLRLERANILGYDSHAAYVLERSMAKTPEGANDLLNMLWPKALEQAKNERAMLEKMMHSEGTKGALQPSDWWHYAEKVRLAEYDLDEEMLRPYLSLDSVRDGVLKLTTMLYGITYKPLPDLPKYHKDVEAYEVLDKDGSHLAVIYFDFFPRPGKGAGAWCTTFNGHHIDQQGKKVAPVVSIVCNFTPPTGDQPALLLFDEAQTLFHEYGHALHSFFNTVSYPMMGSVSRDFVELPSQIMEHWASEPEFLKIYARHYETGEPMPDELIEKLEKSGKFNQGFATLEYLGAAILDMRYHARTEPLTNNVAVFEREAMDELGMIPEILPRYRSTYFGHIFSGGYSSGYYSYIWSEVLDCDAYQAFVETGDIFNRDVANAFREKILRWGNAKDSDQMFRDFRGRDAVIEPLLENRGLSGK